MTVQVQLWKLEHEVDQRLELLHDRLRNNERLDKEGYVGKDVLTESLKNAVGELDTIYRLLQLHRTLKLKTDLNFKNEGGVER